MFSVPEVMDLGCSKVTVSLVCQMYTKQCLPKAPYIYSAKIIIKTKAHLLVFFVLEDNEFLTVLFSYQQVE